MKIQKRSESSDLYQPKLDSIPGWVALSPKKQGELYEHTSHIHQHRQLQMLGEFGELMELYQVQVLLEGEEVQMKDYLRQIYPDRSVRFIDRKREVFAQLVASIPPAVLKRLTSIGIDVLGRFERITNAALGDIRNAVKELPALTAGTDKAAEEYLERLDTKLSEHRQSRQKGKPLKQDEQFAAKMATNGVLHYLRSCGLKSSSEKRKFLTRVMGWVMEAQAITGTLRAGRIPIPDGILIRRGRPRKNPKSEVA